MPRCEHTQPAPPMTTRHPYPMQHPSAPATQLEGTGEMPSATPASLRHRRHSSAVAPAQGQEQGPAQEREQRRPPCQLRNFLPVPRIPPGMGSWCTHQPPQCRRAIAIATADQVTPAAAAAATAATAVAVTVAVELAATSVFKAAAVVPSTRLAATVWPPLLQVVTPPACLPPLPLPHLPLDGIPGLHLQHLAMQVAPLT